MRNSTRIVFLFLALAANGAALAQQTVVFSVPGWDNLSNRDDRKGIANSFTWGYTAPVPGAPSGKHIVQDAILSIPIGDPALKFAQTAMRSQYLPSVLVEFPSKGSDPRGPAPFAFRLTEVYVSSVSFSKSSSDGGPGAAEVKLSAAKIEMFSGTQDPKGALRPAGKAGYDVKAGKAF
jgi:hypothetical protein